MYAHIHQDTITQTRHTLPQTWEHDGRVWDIRPGQHDPADAGWHEVIDTPRPADTDTGTHDRSIELVAGVPTVTWTPRPWTAEERAARAESDARLDDLTARVARIEAHLWPAPGDPTTPDDPTVADWATLGGIWPDQGLLREGGTIWRNVSGVPLTTPPSGFPGTPQQWGHLFVAALAPEPEPPAPTVPAWSATESYAVGDVVSHDGQVWECKVAHGPEQQGQWRPGVAHTVWTAVP